MSRSRALLLCALTVFVTARSGKAQSPEASTCGIREFPAPQLCARAGLDTVRARYVILVDESGSMRPLWPAVRQALATFAEAIPEGDELDVRAFSSDVRVLVPVAEASTVTRRSWAETMRTLPEPRGASTDLGAASAAALQSVRQAPASQVQFVFFLTDGRHQPAANSRFPIARTSNAWHELLSDAQAVRSGRPMAVSIVRLSAEADASVIQAVYPDAVPTGVLDESALRQWFTNVVREAAVTKLVTMVRRELARPVVRLESANPLRLHSDRIVARDVVARERRHIVRTVLVDSSAVSTSAGGRVVPSSSLWDGDSVSLRIADAPRAIWVLPGSTRETLDERIAVRTRLEPADELERIGIAAGPRSDSIALKLATLGGSRLNTPQYLLVALGLALLAVLGAVLAKWKLHRPYLFGRFIYRSNSTEPESSTPPAVDLSALRSDIHHVSSSDGQRLLTFVARSERGRTRIHVEPGLAGITMNGQRLASGTRVERNCRFETPKGEIQYFHN